jgi:isocitrate dehydrogenase
VAEFAERLERVVIDTVEGGKMTKDLAALVGRDQPFLETIAFMDAIDANLQAALR